MPQSNLAHPSAMPWSRLLHRHRIQTDPLPRCPAIVSLTLCHPPSAGQAETIPLVISSERL